MTPRKAGAPKSSIYQRTGSPLWWIRRTVPGLGGIRLSTRTTSEKHAARYDDLVCELREHRRLDALSDPRSGQVTLKELHENRDPKRLADLLTRTAAPLIRPLIAEWLEIGANDSGIRDASMRRYERSWKHIFAILPEGARLDHIDQKFVTNLKRHRFLTTKEQGKALTGATLNRDLAALGAFLSWCAREKGLAVKRPHMKYHPESRGRVRWLTSEEWAKFRENCPAVWWPFFGLLFATGITISEARGLLVCDLDLKEGRVSIHEEYGRKLKRASRARELSIPESLIPSLAAHIEQATEGPMDKVFPFSYGPPRRAWLAICKAAKIACATIHDSRHTFAVHAVMNGVPEA